MTTGVAEVGELPLESLVTCKMCLSEYSLDKMTALQDCNCIFCTSVSMDSNVSIVERKE